MITVKAKLKCESVLQTESGETIKFRAVSGPGNESWSKWTPCADFSMSVTNPNVFEYFKPGSEYTIAFSCVE